LLLQQRTQGMPGARAARLRARLLQRGTV